MQLYKRPVFNLFYSKLFAVAIICCLGVLVYSNTFNGGFHFDDSRFIINSGAIKNLTDLEAICGFSRCLRFITDLTFALNYRFHGMDVFGYHLVNILIHLASGILVWWMMLLILAAPSMRNKVTPPQTRLLALFAGLIFVTHPVQTEAVAYIYQRSTALVAMFCLASLCLYAGSRLTQEYAAGYSKKAGYYYAAIDKKLNIR